MRNRFTSRMRVAVAGWLVLMGIGTCFPADPGKAWTGPRAGYPEDTIWPPPEPAAPELPPYLGTWVDPTTLTAIRRITRYVPEWDWYPHHEYSKIQPWNIDQTLYRFYSVAVFDAVSHRVVRELPGDLYPCFWSNTDPDTLFSFREDGTIKRYSVAQDTETELGTLAGYDRVTLGPGEGNIDIHDRLVALVAKSGADLDVVVWDLQQGRTVSTRRFAGAWGGGEVPEHVDWVSISQSGEYVVMLWNTGPPWDVQPFDGHFGVEVYDPSDMTLLRRIARYGDHGDLGFTPTGEEVYVQFWGEHGTINAYHLADGRVDVIHTDPDFGFGDAHISCRNILRPGWAYVSTDPARHGAILAVKLDGSETVELFGHHLSTASSYLVSPMPVPSPDGRKVMFKTDFGITGDPELVYEFEASSADAVLLYHTDRDLHVTVGQGTGGGPTFTASRADGLPLREAVPGERFFEDRSGGALSITWTVEERPGGVDVVYDIANGSAEPQPLPVLRIDGLRYAAGDADDSLMVLDTATHQYLHRRFLNEPSFLDGSGHFTGSGFFDPNGLEEAPYPRVYAPVIVASDGRFAAGSSLEVHFTADELRPLMRLELEPGRHWSHVYDLGWQGQRLPAGESLRLRMTLRFAAPRSWLVTLYPYKLWFDQLYGGQAAPVSRDTRPISGVSLSYETVAWEQYQACLADGACPGDGQPLPESTVTAWNLRGYNWELRTDRWGLDGPNPDHGDRGFVSTYVARLLEAGFQRSMLWTFSGQYWTCPEDQLVGGVHPYCATNFPPQFMSDLPSAMAGSLDALEQFSDAGIELGFWWGRAGQIPDPMGWNPDAVLPLDPANPDHASFAETELSLAVQRGARALGLDAFGNMAPEDQLGWLAHLAEQAPGVELWTEGSVADYLHTRAALFLQPLDPWAAGPFTGTPIEEPALLPAYLVPGGEIIVYLGADDDPGFTSELQQLVRNGYTPLIAAHPDIFDVPLTPVAGLDPARAACADGEDNDGDGLADFPFDPGCASPGDGSEALDPASIPDEIAEIFDLDGTAPENSPAGAHPGAPEYDLDGDGMIGAADAASLLGL